MGSWYVAQVAPGREIIARDHIIWRGHGAFVPTFTRTFQTQGERRKRITVKRPWMPRYVFIEGPNIPWWLLDRMTIVSGVLAPNGRPLAIPQHAMDWFMSNNGVIFDETLQKERNIRIGDLVRVASGPLHGELGVVEYVKGKSLTMNGARRVCVPLDQVEKVEAA
jgi:transcription antitermination factor NusG